VTLEAFLRDSATARLVEVIHEAMSSATRNQTKTHLAHLADALLEDDQIGRRLKAEPRLQAKAALARQIASLPAALGDAGNIAFDLGELGAKSIELAAGWEAKKVSPLTMLAACLEGAQLKEPESVKTQELLRAAGLSLASLMPQQSPQADFTYKSLGFGRDLTALARAGRWTTCPLVGMEVELRRLVSLISTGSDSVVLVGEPGVGKSAIVSGLAYHIAHGTRPLIPAEMDNWTIVEIPSPVLVAGTGIQGSLQERLNKLLDFFRKNPSVVPFFDEVHTLLNVEDKVSQDIATALKPPMANGEFRCIGATTDKEYVRFIVNDEAMNSRFVKILLPEPDVATCKKIIQGSLEQLVPPSGRNLGVELTEEAISASIDITTNHQRTDKLPRKALKLLRQTASYKVYEIQTVGSSVNPKISAADVARRFSEDRTIPLDHLADQSALYRGLRERLAARVKGQAGALDAVVSRLEFQATGWVPAGRPRGCFLFLGPSGVGKTELASRLAEEVMRDRGSLVEKNFSDYQNETARSRFTGADPGYIGFGQTHTIYGTVMMRPYSIVVFDQIEKAHPSLADPLARILSGRAEDSQGRSVDFSHCIFVMTSNVLDLHDVGEREQSGTATTLGDLRSKLSRFEGIFASSDFLKRIDEIVLFRPLTAEDLHQILDGLIEDTRGRATKPLPPEIDSPEARDSIIAVAQQHSPQSAGGLERAFLDWLSTRAHSTADVR
jgi:ATP-dependent Clp protease ATP-binding subunit ClpC